ncbi:MAG: PAS domain S-box protein, partial [Melioribacteraceae bacterium]|nr:PAS domain S-box protein [Melioribacteraceae bacterium]
MKQKSKPENSLQNIDIQNLLYDVSLLSFKNFRLRDFLKEIHKRISGLMSAKNFFVALHHKTTDTYTFPYYIDEFDTIDPETHLKLQNTLTDYVCKSKKAEIITSEREREIFKNKFQVIGEYSPVWIGAPLFNPTTNEVIGVIALQDYENENAYNLKDLKTLEIIARNIGLFIDRIRTLSILQESEERFRTIFKEDKTIKIVIDQKTGRIVEANEAAFEFYGYDDLTSKYIFDINILQPQQVRSAMNRAIKKSINKFNFRHKTASGEIRDVDVFSTPMKVNNKDVLFSMIFDVTERNKIEAALKESEQKLNEAEKIAHLGNFQFNLKTGETNWSDGAFKIFGLDQKKDKLLSIEDFYSFVHVNDRKLLKQEIEKSNKQNRTLNTTFRIIRKDNKTRYIHKIGKINFSADGKTKYLFGAIQDITNSKRDEELLLQSKKQLEIANAAKDKFFSILAHDLRSPFTSLIGYSEFLIDDIEELSKEEIKSFAGNINESAQVVFNLLENLLQWSRVQTGRIKIDPEIYDISHLADSTINLLKN